MTETATQSNVVDMPRPAAPLATVPQSSQLRRFEPLQFSDEQRRMMRDTLLNGASEEEASMLLEVARLRGLNPITRQIHFVKRWDSNKGREVWAYQVSIDGLRMIAERTGLYDGQDEPEFERDAKGNPIACRVRVYRKDIARAFVGVAYFSEYAQTKKDGKLTNMWETKPHVMIAKCAEALALRKGFPEDMGGMYTDDEIDVTPREHPAPAPAPRMVPSFDLTSRLDRLAKAATGDEIRAIDAEVGPAWDSLSTTEQDLYTKERTSAVEALVTALVGKLDAAGSLDALSALRPEIDSTRAVADEASVKRIGATAKSAHARVTAAPAAQAVVPADPKPIVPPPPAPPKAPRAARPPAF